ncbi:signal peptidase I, partial [Candidatus Roizmanbacteria bacterium CG22_combo_CG10-13_8_21_14_all_38_20]
KSGSMQPAIHEGSLILTEKKDIYSIGDVIAYKLDKEVVTHRIFAYHNTASGERYITKGDANNVADPNPVNYPNILGRQIKQIPWLGYLVSFTKQPLGFILLIIIPSTVIVYQELVGLKQHLFKKKIAHLAIACVIVLGLHSELTNSYFAESASSSNNLIAAASSFSSSLDVGNLSIKVYFCPIGTSIGVDQQSDSNGNATIPDSCSEAGSNIHFRATNNVADGDDSPPDDDEFDVFDYSTDASGTISILDYGLGTLGVAEFPVDGDRLADFMLLGFLCSNSAGDYDNNYELATINVGSTTYCNAYNLSFGGGSPF